MNPITWKQVAKRALLVAASTFAILIPFALFISWRIFGDFDGKFAVTVVFCACVAWFQKLYNDGCRIHGVTR